MKIRTDILSLKKTCHFIFIVFGTPSFWGPGCCFQLEFTPAWRKQIASWFKLLRSGPGIRWCFYGFLGCKKKGGRLCLCENMLVFPWLKNYCKTQVFIWYSILRHTWSLKYFEKTVCSNWYSKYDDGKWFLMKDYCKYVFFSWKNNKFSFLFQIIIVAEIERDWPFVSFVWTTKGGWIRGRGWVSYWVNHDYPLTHFTLQKQYRPPLIGTLYLDHKCWQLNLDSPAPGSVVILSRHLAWGGLRGACCLENDQLSLAQQRETLWKGSCDL